MEINCSEDKSFTASKSITVTTAEGTTVEIATLYGSVELERSTNYSFTVLNKELYLANREAIQLQVDAFVAEIKAKIDELGGLHF